MSVELFTQEGVAILRLNRPQALNALSFQIVRDISAAIDQVAAWGMAREVRALVVTGAGDKSFCAGADIKEFQGRSLIDAKRGAEAGQLAFAKLDRLPVASVAAINGYAFGGGMELALACTFRIAARTRENGAAGDQARRHPGLWRHPTPAAPDRRGPRARDDHDRPHRPRRGG